MRPVAILRGDPIQPPFCFDPEAWRRAIPVFDHEGNEVHRHSVPVTASRDPQGLLTMTQAATRLNITPDQLKAFVDDGSLRFINVGRGRRRPRYRFTVSDLDAFIASRTTQETSAPCRSTRARSTGASISSISRSKVIGFMDRRAALLAAKPKKSKR
jgi:excisionase family DNA binding protein